MILGFCLPITEKGSQAKRELQWIVENYNGRCTLSEKEGDDAEIDFSASLIQ